MLIDLAQPDRDATLETQVCIVGAGPAGLTLARALAVRGINVVLVEIGGSIPEVRSDRQDFVFDRREYKGATLGRAFGFGGTSAFWGGGLLPVRPTELAARDAGTGAWPLAYSDIEDQFDQLQTWLGVDTLPFDLKFARQTRHPLGNFDWQGLDPLPQVDPFPRPQSRFGLDRRLEQVGSCTHLPECHTGCLRHWRSDWSQERSPHSIARTERQEPGGEF